MSCGRHRGRLRVGVLCGVGALVAPTPWGPPPGAMAAEAPAAEVADAPDLTPIAPPTRASGATTALVVAPTRARARPGGGRLVAPVPVATSWSGQPTTLLVLGSAEHRGARWLKVALPIRSHGSVGWIPDAAASLGRTGYWVDVHLGTRTVTVSRMGRTVRRARAVVGAPRTPTPRGLTAIYEINRQPNPRAFLGPWAIALTATSRVLQHFDGGPGRIGLHGRGSTSLADPLGSARSAGCIRIDNGPIIWMARNLAAGVPVMIRP